MEGRTSEGPMHWLRSLLGSDPDQERTVTPGCCVSGCSGPAPILVATRRGSSLWMCTPHAQRWLESPEGFAAQSDPPRSHKLLARWANAAGGGGPMTARF